MQTATLQEIKKELKALSEQQLVDLTLHLAKFKKENKDYLAYLLFSAHDKTSFLAMAKTEIEELIASISLDTNLYYAKKSVRKILRIVAKYSRYSEDKAFAVELRIHFCLSLIQSGIRIKDSDALMNIYLRELKKIEMLILKLHPDLQNDFRTEMENLKTL